MTNTVPTPSASPDLLLFPGPPLAAPFEPPRDDDQVRRRVRRLLSRRYRMLRSSNDELLRQLRLAEEIQRSLLPRVLPSPPGVTFAAGFRPTLHLAGDFYNAFRLDADHVGFYVGDVMGHGPAAALLSVFAMQSLLTKRIDGHHYEILPPDLALEGLSRTLIAANLPGYPFLTMVYGVLDTAQRTWTYCCGGHPYPMLLRAGEPPRYLDATGPLLGILELPFRSESVTLEPGDRLVLYSDGAMEARWGGHGRGVDGLAASLSHGKGHTLQTQIDASMDSIDFEDNHPDDVALLVAHLDA